MDRAEKLANELWPIVPLKCELSSAGEILNNDEALDNFRIHVQSISSNNGFIQGYHQAEKDLALTWKDIDAIAEIGADFMNSEESDDLTDEQYYTEILNRFNSYLKEKNGAAQT